MKKPSVFLPLIGSLTGALPATLLLIPGIVSSSSGHGSETVNLMILIAIGIPGMALGSLIGSRLQQRSNGSKRHLYIAASCLLGALSGFAVALLFFGDFLTAQLGARKGEIIAAGTGLILGGAMATLLVSRVVKS